MCECFSSVVLFCSVLEFGPTGPDIPHALVAERSVQSRGPGVSMKILNYDNNARRPHTYTHAGLWTR